MNSPALDFFSIEKRLSQYFTIIWSHMHSSTYGVTYLCHWSFAHIWGHFHFSVPISLKVHQHKSVSILVCDYGMRVFSVPLSIGVCILKIVISAGLLCSIHSFFHSKIWESILRDINLEKLQNTGSFSDKKKSKLGNIFG